VLVIRQRIASGPIDRTRRTPFQDCIRCPTVLSCTTDATHYQSSHLWMISVTLHIIGTVKLHSVSYVSSRHWFILHIVQGWAIRYLN